MDTVPNTFPALFAGYTVIWVLLIGYMFCLGYRVRRLEKKHKTPTETQKSGSNAD
jgi:CcmD family protein